jgi:hypothetical protein
VLTCTIVRHWKANGKNENIFLLFTVQCTVAAISTIAFTDVHETASVLRLLASAGNVWIKQEQCILHMSCRFRMLRVPPITFPLMSLCMLFKSIFHSVSNECKLMSVGQLESLLSNFVKINRAQKNPGFFSKFRCALQEHQYKEQEAN